MHPLLSCLSFPSSGSRSLCCGLSISYWASFSPSKPTTANGLLTLSLEDGRAGCRPEKIIRCAEGRVEPRRDDGRPKAQVHAVGSTHVIIDVHDPPVTDDRMESFKYVEPGVPPGTRIACAGRVHCRGNYLA